MGVHNFHVPLSPELYSLLRQEAQRTKQPATQLVRLAIEEWLHKQRKAARDEAIRDYAKTFAGSESDLDEELEETSLEYLLSQESES